MCWFLIRRKVPFVPKLLLSSMPADSSLRIAFTITVRVISNSLAIFNAVNRNSIPSNKDKIIFIVSHDIEFLNEVADEIFEL